MDELNEVQGKYFSITGDKYITVNILKPLSWYTLFISGHATKGLWDLSSCKLVQGLHHWTTREVSEMIYFNRLNFISI